METITTKGRPFIKWAGGKGQLLTQLEQLLPNDFDTWQDVTYIEPFVGGGAMLFHLLGVYPNIRRAVINDINPDLMCCYTAVRDFPRELIEALQDVQNAYRALQNETDRKVFYLDRRSKFNTKALPLIENAALFIFLNRTCFNGLYRVNKSGQFNVPFGRYANPTICDKETILADSAILQRVEIMTDDFEATFSKACGQTLFYFDPPYRPLSSTSNFNDYAKVAFNDDSQVRLKLFCDRIDSAGHCFLLSNSDCFGAGGGDLFFDKLFSQYDIKRVLASRSINSVASKRGKLTEIVVRNFSENTLLDYATTPRQQYKQHHYDRAYESTL